MKQLYSNKDLLKKLKLKFIWKKENEIESEQIKYTPQRNRKKGNKSKKYVKKIFKYKININLMDLIKRIQNCFIFKDSWNN